MPKISVVIPIYNLENYIRNMLESVKQQTFKDFEAILIDDGSSDSSAKIALEFVEKDSRFKLIQQENQGVSAARNRGMDAASGEYIIFFDGDDYIPPKALKHLYRAISKNDCQMTVGIMKTYNDGAYSVNKPTKLLAEKKSIDPTDLNFIKTWSQCNKLYRLDFIRQNNISFIDVKVAEDGHFLYQVLSKVKRICGCNHEVYHYIRRPFWSGEYTASKNVGINYLKDRLKVYDNMLEYCDEIFAEKPENEKTVYLDELLTRFIKGGIVQAFYKRIWRCDNAIIPQLAGALKYFKEKISENRWNEIAKAEWEIQLEKRLLDTEDNSFKTQIINDPVVSVIIIDDMDADNLNLTMNSLYSQEFSAFNVMINQSLFDKLDKELRKKENICVTDETSKAKCVSNARGKYIYIVDEMAVLHTHVLKKMADKLQNNDGLGFISAYIKGFNHREANNMYYRLKTMDAVFGYGKKGHFGKDDINVLDNYFVNKLFRRKVLLDPAFLGDPFKFICKLYDNYRFEKTRTAWVLTNLLDDSFRERSMCSINETNINIHCIKNRCISYLSGVRRIFKS